jgi:hypothetical protein
MKGITYVDPNPDSNERYVGLSEDYLIFMHFNQATSKKISQGYELTDDLIE